MSNLSPKNQMNEKLSRPNVHISYGQKIRPCHVEIARLVEKYAPDSCRLLEVGCGVGHTLSLIRKKQPDIRIFGADIDENLLKITDKRVALDESLKISTAEELFDLGLRFDIVIMSHVLEHTFRPLDIVRGIMEMLEPNGVAILAVPNPVRLTVFYGNILKRHYVNRGHVYAWDRSHWINFLENIAGLNVEEYSQDYFPVPGLGKLSAFRPVEIKMAKVFPWLAFSNIAVVRKLNGTKLE